MKKLIKKIKEISKYSFLLKELVMRDFKIKYRRSYLGMLWSLFNPLLMMTVFYFVFSTIFKSSIENFPLYLLSGIIVFNYFSECTNNALISITGNASLITKVYVPKMIFPLAKVLSSSVNFFISLIPLLGVVIITGSPINIYTPLIFFNMVMFLIFCVGIGLFLSTIMTFFRDTQFLWTIILMVWMYGTPVFYPVSIIPLKYLFIYKLNPLFHYITFSRTILIQGVSPSFEAYLTITGIALASLLFGTLVFKLNENKLVNYL